MQTQDQSAVIDFLERSAGADAAQRIETHISRVFLTGDRVFKLKRAVQFPYLDFSTPELRLAACEKEFDLNRRTAPDLYLRVRRIVRDADGVLSFDGEGEFVDAVIEMRRFDQRDLFDAMAKEGRLTPDILTQLAHEIAAFHKDAAPDLERDGAQAIEAALDANESGFAESRIFDPAKLTRLFNLCHMRLDQFHAVLDARGREGKVRRCHGDLHLRNICLFEGKPLLFDCLEFDETLATTDVLYDLAFLLMDLVHRGLRREANLVFNRYVDETDDDAALALLPFFMGIRAAVRAHVGAAAAAGNPQKAAEASDYLTLALDLLAGHERGLVAIGGRSGTGKSSVAAAIAGSVGDGAGARILSTDRLRKRLAGIAPTERLPPSSYTPESSDAVYEEQRRSATRVLHGGCSVIVDGVFLKECERRAIEAVAHDSGVPFAGIWLEAAPEILKQRVVSRSNDPSDATADVVEFQHRQTPGILNWAVVETAGSVGEIAERVLSLISTSTPVTVR